MGHNATFSHGDRRVRKACLASASLGWLLLVTAGPAMSQPAANGQSSAPPPAAAIEHVAPSSTTDPSPVAAERLLALLQAIPKRWDGIPQPLVPPTGRPPEAVIEAASETEIKNAVKLLAQLATAPEADRPGLMQSAMHSRPLNEVDLWVPAVLVDKLESKVLLGGARELEAWLQWAEAVGRKDILQEAASIAMDKIGTRLGAVAVLPAASAWAALPPTAGAERGQAMIVDSLADLLFRAGQNQEALEAYRKARQLDAVINNKIGQAYTWLGEADVLFHIGRNQEAIHAYQSARQIFVSLDQKSGQGNTWKGEGDVLFLLGEDQQALHAYATALQLFVTADDQLGQGNSLQGTADVLFRQGKNQEALDTYRQARRIYVAINAQEGQGNGWVKEGDVLTLLGEHQKALEAYRNARHIYLAISDKLGQGNTWVGEAVVLSHLGEYQKALDAFRSARQLFIDVDVKLGQGNTWRGEANVLFELGELQKALDAFRKARELYVADDDKLGQGNTWEGEAKVQALLGDDQAALGAYRKARGFFVAADEGVGQGNSWEGEADVLLALGDDQQALSDYRISRSFFVTAGDPIGQGNAWLGEALALRKRDAWTEVATAAGNAVARFEASGVAPNQISALLLEAQAEDRLGDRQAAVRAATHAIELHAQWRKNFITDSQRTEHEESIAAAYDILIPLRARQEGQATEALRLAEEAHSHVLLDLLATTPNRGEAVPPVDLMAERQRLETAIWEVEEELRGTPAPQREQELRERRRQLDRELEWNGYQRIAAQNESLANAPPLDAAAIQELTHQSGPILLFYAANEEVWGFLVLPPPAGILVRSIAISWGDLGREVRELSRDLANPLYEARAQAQARRFWDLFIAPFADHIPDGRPLVLVPHGPLHEVPFEALVDPTGKLLLDHWTTSVAPSASVLALAAKRHAEPSTTDSFVAFSSGRGLTLPASEVVEISRFFDNKVAFHPTEALYTNYEKLASQARHLLIATRGVHLESSRSDTYLEIQPTPDVHDSRLNAAEIATIPLQAELVTLAACDTAHGHALLSDERLDLARSFLIARAVAVLATRWKVPEDIDTSRFLVDFYRAYRKGGKEGKGLRKDEALNEARRLSRARHEPAQLWSAWVLIGDAR